MTEYVGFAAAFCTTISFLPQAIHTIRTRHTKDLSLRMYLLFTIGVFLWLLYGIALHDLPMMLANSVTLALSSVILTMKLRYG